MKSRVLFSCIMLVTLFVSACGESSEPSADGDLTPGMSEATPADTSQEGDSASMPDEIVAEQVRIDPAAAGQAGTAALVEGFNRFAFDLYHAVTAQQDGNLVYSPASIELAFSMVYAGARGGTEAQMADVLGFLPQEEHHLAANALDQYLAALGEDAPPAGEQQGEPFQLNIANAVWGQHGFPFEQAFLDTLAAHYGAGVRLADFVAAAEAARQEINAWVEERTEGRITDLVPENALTEATRLVLANAIYFNAAWLYPFSESDTAEGPFTLLDGSQVTASMMHHGVLRAPYTAGDGYQAVALPYTGRGVEMVIVLPEEGRFEEIEAGLSAEFVRQARGGAETYDVNLTMPRFDFESQLDLTTILQEMGLTAPFGPADFSGIAQDSDLFISEAVHKATIAVDETGTEATAATGIAMEASAMPTGEVTIDRPFIFAIVERETDAILFLGRVTNPTG